MFSEVLVEHSVLAEQTTMHASKNLLITAVTSQMDALVACKNVLQPMGI